MRGGMNPEELTEFADHVLDMVWNAGEEGISARELAGCGSPFGRWGNPSNILTKMLFAHPNIKRIGNTKTTRYVYTEDFREGVPWLRVAE